MDTEDRYFNKEAIADKLTGHAKGITLEVREMVSSTNTVLLQMAEQGKPEGTVLIAEQQSAGKGRLGRSFYSPKGSGLYMSLLLRPDLTPEESLSITTAAAVAVAGAIEAVTGGAAKIKWVNDVYLNGYKVCGILTEASLRPAADRLQYAVLGIGVNICQPKGGFGESLQEVAGALYREQPPADTGNRLAAEILNRFFAFYAQLPRQPFLREYQERSLLTGLKIHFVLGNQEHFGTVVGIDDKTRLTVCLENGEIRAFSAGEVDVSKDFLEQIRT